MGGGILDYFLSNFQTCVNHNFIMRKSKYYVIEPYYKHDSNPGGLEYSN